MGAPLDRYREVETGQPFTPQNQRLLKIELSEATVMTRNGSMVAYQGDVRFEPTCGGLGRLLKKAATGEQLRLMQATGSGELFLAHQAMLVREGRHGRHARRRPVQHPPARAPGWWRSRPTASRFASTSQRPPPSPTRRPRSRGRAA